MQELKVVIYLLILTIIYRLILWYTFQKSSYNWKGYLNNTELGGFWVIIRFLWIVYIIGRLILFPFTVWFFNIKF